MKSKKPAEVDIETGEELCETCGSVKVTEEGQKFCPHCDTVIDFFGEDDDDDTK